MKTHSVQVSILDTNSVPNTVSTTIQVTFTGPPTVANPMTAQTMYQGMGAHTISIPANTFASASGALTITATNNLSGVTPTIFTVTGNNLNVELPSTFTGSFTVTLTATNSASQSVTNQFLVTVSACTQTNCVACTGTGAAQCTRCNTGFTLTAGACTSNSSTGSSYLNRSYQEVSPEGVGAPVFGMTTLAVGLGFITGSVPVVAGLGVGQCQTVQVMSLFNMNVPNEYVDYSLSYEITKIDIKFIDFIELQDSLNTGARRNLDVGYTSLSNIGFYSGNFIVNYCYYFLLMVILVLVHLVVLWIVSMN